ncbi:MAG: DUF1587 domain-containing protein, partial [Armatimonadetes bacterium]|nr:DUF1587 domain-containing protein [Armatimonadota bacterium]
MQGIPRGWAPGGVLIGFVSLVGAAAAAPMSRPAAPANHNTVFQRQVLPLVQKYCINCHGPRLQSAEVGFHTFKTDQEFVQGRAVWEHASKRMASHQMPPRGAPQPTDRERQFLVTWIDTRLSAAECAVKDPGRVTLRRLNRAEYDNTLRDLLGIELKLSQDFPSDDVGYGFDNIGDVLTLSPLLMEKYLAAAEKAAAATIVTPEPPDPFLRLEAERLPADGATAVLGTGFRGIYSNGEVRTEIPLEKPGEYLVRIRAYGQQAGSDPVRMEVLFGGAEPQPFAVKAEARSPEVYEMRVRSGPGKQTLVVQYTNDFQDRFNPNPERRDRNLFLDYVEVAGPLFAADTPLPASHLRLIPVVPAKGQEEAAARTALRSFARRAYRRPVSEAEVQRLVNCVRLALKEGESYQRGMQLALQAALVSPNFLFRVELDPAGGPDTAGKAYPLNDHELACRLSYFLW